MRYFPGGAGALGRGRGIERALGPYRFATPTRPARIGGSGTGLHPYRWLARWLQHGVEHHALGGRFARRLERADPDLVPGEALALWLLGTIAVCAAGGLAAQFVGLALGMVFAVSLPVAWERLAEDRRAQRFAAELPVLLQSTAASLRAGFSLLQSLSAVSRQLDEPAAGELARVFAEVRLGHSLEEALDECAQRVANPDFSETVAAIRIQQETGGNLAGLFDVLAETMLGRSRLRREVRVLTAETRMSAYVLGALPVLLGALISVIDTAYTAELLHSRAGQLMLVGAVVLELIGFALLYRLSQVGT